MKGKKMLTTIRKNIIEFALMFCFVGVLMIAASIMLGSIVLAILGTAFIAVSVYGYSKANFKQDFGIIGAFLGVVLLYMAMSAPIVFPDNSLAFILPSVLAVALAAVVPTVHFNLNPVD